MPVDTVPKLVNKETTAQSDPIPTYGQSLRCSCRPAFDAAECVYTSLDSHKDRSRAERLRYCRSRAWFFRHVDTGEVRVGSSACHLRWCPVCARARRNYLSHEVGQWISKQKFPKLITFTLKHSDEPLLFQIDRLYKAFREVRRRKEFRKKITGGVWFFQIKRSSNDGLWHPHLHCLATGFYLYNRKLSQMWAEITLDSTMVDVKSIHDPQAAANDVARYAAAPGSLISLPLESACELVNALHGRRVCGTWGSGRALSLRPAKNEDSDKWHNIGDWYMVLGMKEYSENARAIINAWMDKTPLDSDIDCFPVPKFIDDELKTHWNQMTLDELYQTERSPP